MRKIFMVGASAVASVLLMTGCNKQVIDLTYEYSQAQIKMPDGTVIEGKVDSWNDYEGDQLQVKINGTTYHRQQHQAFDPQVEKETGDPAEEQEKPAMSMRLELSDLPPRYRAQAEKQLAQRRCGGKAAPASLEAAVNAARSTGHEFDSRGEYDYYMGTVLPKVQSGEVVKVELHRRFTMLPEKEYGNVKLPAAHYTPDFVLTYADGTVEVVEVKSKFTRRQQRDYIHRRRMFIDLVAEPQHWRFIEHITPDTAEEIRKWKRLAEQAGKDSSWEKAGQGCQHSTGRASRMQ